MARVLIVDDEASIRETLGAFAERSGYDTTLAENASVALERLSERSFDIVVSDIVLPQRSGVSLLKEIRVMQPDAQVIMITGEPEVLTASESVRQGAFDYLAKPVKRALFEQVLASAASKKALIDRNRELEEENQRHREDLEKRVNQRTQELQLINGLARALALAESVDEVLEIAHQSIRSHMDVEFFIVSRFDRTLQRFTAEYAYLEGEKIDVRKLPPIPLEPKGHGMQSEVIHTGQMRYIPNYDEARPPGVKEYNVDNQGEVREGPPPADVADAPRSAIYIPLLIQGAVCGVMQAQSFRVDGYSASDISLLQGVAGVVSVALENTRLLESIRDALHGTIDVLGRSTELRDPYTAGHQRRVASLAVAIGEQLHLTRQQIEGLQAAALIHDIGKSAIPAEILSKPGRLSEYEMRFIQEHPQRGYDLLKSTAFPWPVADAILQHHERLDGSGYPDGLVGDQIIREARILAVCDVVEAMSSHRPYRPSHGVQAALEEIRTKRGTQFDRDVVDACVRIFESSAFHFKS